MKEECLAERISITKVKTNNMTASRVFEENEFAVSHHIDEIKVADDK